jgi:signal transduction histidine kinase
MNHKEAIVSVKDTGTGIDPQIFHRLFTKFATKSVTGNGLGLFISRVSWKLMGARCGVRTIQMVTELRFTLVYR